MTKKIPPYFANKDGYSCQQAVIKMILSYFEPDKYWSWEEMDELCEYEKGKATWDTFAIYNLTSKMGYECLTYDDFNHKAFSENPKEYLSKVYDEEFTEWCYENSNIALAVKYAENIALNKNNLITIQQKSYTLDDLKNLISKNFLICAWVDSNILSRRSSGEVNGHFILIYNIDDKYIYFYNPGGILPESDPETSRLPNQKEPIKHFFKACTVNGRTGSLNAYRKAS